MAEQLTFSDSIEDNLNTMRELIGNMPASAQHRARGIADKVGTVIAQIQKDYPNDPAAGIGVCWVLHHLAQEMTKNNKPLIQLLS